MRIGRFDLAQSCRDHQQAVRIFGHLPQASDKHRPLDSEGAHQIREILALDNAHVLKSRNRVVAQLQCPTFHSTEPARKKPMTCRRCNYTARKFGRYGKRNTQRYRCSTCKATFSEYEPKLGTHYTDPETASKALAMMLEGMSVRAISRLTGLHKGTILSLMLTASQRAGAKADSLVRK